MTTITHERYNTIRKEAITKFIDELESMYYSNPELTMEMVVAAKDNVFSKMDKRLYKNIRRGTPLIRLSVYGEHEI